MIAWGLWVRENGLKKITIVVAALLSGCAGTKVLKESEPIQTTRPLATVSDQHATATLDWVIVRDGPGTWAKNADWDEYLLSISNVSDQSMRVTEIIVVDSLDIRVESQPTRKLLVRNTKTIARRYRDSDIEVRAGRGVGTMLATGAGVTVLGIGVANATAGTLFITGTAFGAGVAAANALLFLGPALAVGGIVRGVNNNAVNNEIEQRQTLLPAHLPPNEELELDVFFPLVPSPKSIEVTYTDATGEHRLTIDTNTVLSGLHIDAPNEEEIVVNGE